MRGAQAPQVLPTTSALTGVPEFAKNHENVLNFIHLLLQMLQKILEQGGMCVCRWTNGLDLWMKLEVSLDAFVSVRGKRSVQWKEDFKKGQGWMW